MMNLQFFLGIHQRTEFIQSRDDIEALAKEIMVSTKMQLITDIIFKQKWGQVQMKVKDIISSHAVDVREFFKWEK